MSSIDPEYAEKYRRYGFDFIRQLFGKLPLEPTNLICPVCGHLCVGKGGIGCIDKPTYVKQQTALAGKE